MVLRGVQEPKLFLWTLFLALFVQRGNQQYPPPPKRASRDAQCTPMSKHVEGTDLG